MRRSRDKYDIMLENPVESRHVDYKGPFSWNSSNNKTRCGIIKDIIAFANSGGGSIVIGFPEEKGKLMHKGLTNEELKTFDSTNIGNLLQNYVEPPINIIVVVRDYEDANYAIIEIPKFKTTPHICIKSYDNILEDCALYVRSANNESTKIKFSEDFRNIINTSLMNRREELLNDITLLLEGDSTHSKKNHDISQNYKKYIDSFIDLYKKHPKYSKVKSYYFSYYYPNIDDPKLFTNSNKLYEKAEQSHTRFRSWPYLFMIKHNNEITHNFEHGLQTVFYSESDLFPESLHAWRIHNNGLVTQFQSRVEPYISTEDGRNNFTEYRFLTHNLADAVESLIRMYSDEISNECIITFYFKIDPVMDDELYWDYNDYRFGGSRYQCKIEKIDVFKRASLAVWRGKRNILVAEILNEILEKFNVLDDYTQYSLKYLDNYYSGKYYHNI